MGYCPKCGRWIEATSGYCYCGYAPNITRFGVTGVKSDWQFGYDAGYLEGYKQGLKEGVKQ